VRLEELGLRFAPIGAVPIPPLCPVAVEIGAAGLCDSDVCSGNGEERS
jgi:hypothetical protein